MIKVHSQLQVGTMLLLLLGSQKESNVALVQFYYCALPGQITLQPINSLSIFFLFEDPPIKQCSSQFCRLFRACYFIFSCLST
jgi:hypothetical protein